MNRLRCPSCGEQAGVPILWGMPDFDTQERVDSGELDVIYGGCTVPDEPVNAGCRACGHRWLVIDPKGEVIDAHVGGGPWGPAYIIRSDGDTVLWTGLEDGEERHETVQPDPDAWVAFWGAVDAAKAWGWGEDYEDTRVTDGTHWSLRLAHDGRVVTSSGSNATPPGWAKVQRALEQLTGRPWR